MERFTPQANKRGYLDECPGCLPSRKQPAAAAQAKNRATQPAVAAQPKNRAKQPAPAVPQKPKKRTGEDSERDRNKLRALHEKLELQLMEEGKLRRPRFQKARKSSSVYAIPGGLPGLGKKR